MAKAKQRMKGDLLFMNLGPLELLVIFGVALLLFGKRLPAVGRSLGQSVVEFRDAIRRIDGDLA